MFEIMKSVVSFHAHNIIKCKKNIINLKNNVTDLNTSNALCFNDSKTLFLINVLFQINTKLI